MVKGAGRGKVTPDPWPQWRGPARDGLLTGVAWPQSLDEHHLTMQCRTEIAEGYSDPIVGADRVFVSK
jgi:hypothetical protein